MLGGVLAHVPLEAVAAVLELAADVLGEVRLVEFLSRRFARPDPVSEVLRGGPRLGAQDQRHFDVACRDLPREFGHQLLRAVAADRFEHGAHRIGADPLRDRTHVVVGRPEQWLVERGADLELPQPGEDLDRLRHGRHVGTGVSKRGPHRLGGQIYR